MGVREQLRVRVNDDLVFDAGTCEEVSGPDGPERLTGPPETTLFHQVAAPGSPRGERSGGAPGQGVIDEVPPGGGGIAT